MKKRYFFVFFFLLALTSVILYSRSHSDFFPRLGEKPPSQNRLESILERSESKLQKNPDDFAALVDQGVAHFLMGADHYGDALNALNEARDAGAFDTRIFYYSGILYENLSMFDEAQKQYDRFIKHEPGDREITLRLARLLFRSGKWAESIARYEEMLKKDAKDVTSTLNLGLAHQMRYQTESKNKGKNRLSEAEIHGFLDSAIQYLEKAQALDAALSKGVYLTLAKLYMEKGDFDRSALSAQAELDKYPGDQDKEAYAVLAAACEKLNQTDKLLEIYPKWSTADPKNPVPLRKLSALKKKLKIK